MSLRKFIYAEYFIGFLVCLYFYWHSQFSFPIFFLLLLVPDIFMLGYLANPKIGALFYNIGHSFVLPAILMIVGFATAFSLLLMSSIIWIAHICMDRTLGYGLKYTQSFKETHLQKIV